MFTGLIQDIGIIRSIRRSGDWRLTIETKLDMGNAPEGASIACSGCCLTVIERGDGWFASDVSAETLSRTSIASWDEGTTINLERSLRLGDELGGHFVFGHVDGLAKIADIRHEGDSRRYALMLPQNLSRFIAVKGSVALDGVSLTVNEIENSNFRVNIIPYTLAHTTLGAKKVGDMLNIEIDMLARYVSRILEKSNP